MNVNIDKENTKSRETLRLNELFRIQRWKDVVVGGRVDASWRGAELKEVKNFIRILGKVCEMSNS